MSGRTTSAQLSRTLAEWRYSERALFLQRVCGEDHSAVGRG